jgi:hypothetical protein
MDTTALPLLVPMLGLMAWLMIPSRQTPPATTAAADAPVAAEGESSPAP